MQHRLLCTIEGQDVFQDDSNRVHFVAKAAIDADGAYRAYHPDNKGLDYLSNAGEEGNWYGIVTDSKGVPYIQRSTDPYPGYYVSATAYQWPDKDKRDPRRYLDSETVPFVVVSPLIRNKAKGVVLGCRAQITNLHNKTSTMAMVGDIGPKMKIGEISMAAAKAIGLDPSPKHGGTDDKIISYELWPDVEAMMFGTTYPLIPA